MSETAEPPWIQISPDELIALEAELRQLIPLAAAMDVRTRGFDGRSLILVAPLEPNVNPKGTAFAGSLYSLAALAGWGMVRLLTRSMRLRCDIVIQESTISYLNPVETSFEAVCPLPEANEWARFSATLLRRGKARITLDVSINQDGRTGVKFHGAYVASQLAADPNIVA